MDTTISPPLFHPNRIRLFVSTGLVTSFFIRGRFKYYLADRGNESSSTTAHLKIAIKILLAIRGTWTTREVTSEKKSV